MPEKANPTTPTPIESQARATAPVITVAEASTIAIWNAAEDTS